jgi:hypothetical protein
MQAAAFGQIENRRRARRLLGNGRDRFERAVTAFRHSRRAIIPLLVSVRFDFTPPAAPVSISGSDASGIDFTSADAGAHYSISGGSAVIRFRMSPFS